MDNNVHFITDLKKLYAAKILTDTQEVATFDTPIYLAGVKEIGLKVKINTEPAYAEGVVWDTDTTVEGIDVEIDVVDLITKEEAFLLGHKISEEGGIIYNAADKAPEVALMFKAMKSDGKARYVVLYRGSFADGDESYKGKEGKTDFQSKKLVGTFAPLKHNGNWKYKIDEADGMTDENFFKAVLIPKVKTEV